jgi:UDP-N-acetylglucosamine acyltransferase
MAVIHPTSIIHPKADLDATVEVGPFCVIDEHVRIDAGCRLMHNVYVTGWTHIEEGCILHPGVIVGHSPQDVKYAGQRTYCRIGARTVLREYVTIHRGTDPESATNVGCDCFLLASSHVGHNCVLGDHVTIINAALLGGHVYVGERAMIGGAVGIHQFVRIGSLAMLAGTARVVQDVLPCALTDERGHIAGVNTVGLRRAGLPPGDIREVRTLFRILLGAGLFETRLALARDVARTATGARILAFLQEPSRRTLAGRSRHRSRATDPE